MPWHKYHKKGEGKWSCEEHTVEEIVHMAQKDSMHDSSNEESEETVASSTVTHRTATAAFDVCIQYFEQQPDSSI